jgi:hypothetical protein
VILPVICGAGAVYCILVYCCGALELNLRRAANHSAIVCGATRVANRGKVFAVAAFTLVAVAGLWLVRHPIGI